MCVVCGREFKTKRQQYAHENGRFDIDNMVFRCCKCEMDFEDGGALTQHLNEHARM